MGALVWAAAGYVVATKFADCWTTARYVRTADNETNALASRLMRRFGFARVVWGIFAFATLWTIALAAAALAAADASVAVGYVLIALFVGSVQLAVARTNCTGRYNAVTRLVLRAHTRGLLRR